MLSDATSANVTPSSTSNGGHVQHSGMAATTVNQPTLVEHGDLKFVITDAPSDAKMENHLNVLVKFGVAHVAQAASEAVYDTSALVRTGIQVHDVSFPDGDPPSPEVINRWLDLVGSAFGKENIKSPNAVSKLESDKRISVHCVAGLGRAPVLVAIALIEYGHMEPFAAVNLIRSKRRGAINKKQLDFLESYKRTRGNANGMGDCCVIC